MPEHWVGQTCPVASEGELTRKATRSHDARVASPRQGRQHPSSGSKEPREALPLVVLEHELAKGIPATLAPPAMPSHISPRSIGPYSVAPRPGCRSTSPKVLTGGCTGGQANDWAAIEIAELKMTILDGLGGHEIAITDALNKLQELASQRAERAQFESKVCAAIEKIEKQFIDAFDRLERVEAAAQDGMAQAMIEAEEVRNRDFQSLSMQASESLAARVEEMTLELTARLQGQCDAAVSSIERRFVERESQLSLLQEEVRQCSADSNRLRSELQDGNAAISAVKVASRGMLSMEALASQQQKQIDEMAGALQSVRQTLDASAPSQSAASLDARAAHMQLAAKFVKLEDEIQKFSKRMDGLQNKVVLEGSVRSLQDDSVSYVEQPAVHIRTMSPLSAQKPYDPSRRLRGDAPMPVRRLRSVSPPVVQPLHLSPTRASGAQTERIVRPTVGGSCQVTVGGSVMAPSLRSVGGSHTTPPAGGMQVRDHIVRQQSGQAGAVLDYSGSATPASHTPRGPLHLSSNTVCQPQRLTSQPPLVATTEGQRRRSEAPTPGKTISPSSPYGTVVAMPGTASRTAPTTTLRSHVPPTPGASPAPSPRGTKDSGSLGVALQRAGFNGRCQSPTATACHSSPTPSGNLATPSTGRGVGFIVRGHSPPPVS